VKISNLTISRRLGIGFLVVVLNMVLLTAVGVTRVEEINSRLSTINDLNSVKQRYAINFRGSVHDRAISLRDVVLAQESTEAEAIAEISAIIGKINDYQLTIASAVEEQTATTNEMNRNVAEAATGAGEIAADIDGVAAATRATTGSVAESRRVAEELSEVSGELQSLVAGFRF
jgi:methyl-accepting chemotaxis protein